MKSAGQFLLAMLGIVGVVLGTYLVLAAQTSDREPVAIAGGKFEASGLTTVRGTSTLLFVDDGRTTEIFAMELDENGAQKGRVAAIPLGAEVVDLEGLTSDGSRFYYAVGSQSKPTGTDGDGLVRFTLDETGRKIADVQRIQGLRAWLAANVPELKGAAGTVGDETLNIEGLAWDARGHRLLLGLRAPVVDGKALIVPIAFVRADGPFSRDNLRVDGAAIRLSLGGAGIRGIEFDPVTKRFQILTGASLNEEARDFHLFEWDRTADAVPQRVAMFPRSLKPEGVARATIGTRSVRALVFDTSRFALLD